MGTEIIRKHNFEASKQRIQELARRVPSSVSIRSFQTEGSFFSFNNHNVTGQEINTNLVSPVQNALISQNNDIKEIYRSFGELYKTFDILDKEYIQSIILSVNAASEASNQAKKASNQAVEATQKANISLVEIKATQESLKKAQEDIRRTVTGLDLMIKKVINFKDDVNSKFSYLSSTASSEGPIAQKVKNLEQICNDYSAQINSIKKENQKLNRLVDDLFNEFIKLQDKSSGQTYKNYFIDIDSLKKKFDKIKDEQDKKLAEFSSITSVLSKGLEAQKNNLLGFHSQLVAFENKVNQITKQINIDIIAYHNSSESKINKIFKDLKGQNDNLLEFHSQFDTFVNNANQITKQINERFVTLQACQNSSKSKIDTILSDLRGQKENLIGLHSQLDNFVNKVNQSAKHMSDDIDALQRCQQSSESRINIIFGDLKSQKNDLLGLHSQLNAFVNKVNQTTKVMSDDIVALKTYRHLLESYVHLRDIDTIWKDVKEHKSTIYGLCNEIAKAKNSIDEHYKQLLEFISETNVSTKNLNRSIDEINERAAQREIIVNKKIKIAYGIAAGSVVFSAVQLILQLVGIL